MKVKKSLIKGSKIAKSIKIETVFLKNKDSYNENESEDSK